jgi:hypothetical protein
VFRVGCQFDVSRNPFQVDLMPSLQILHVSNRRLRTLVSRPAALAVATTLVAAIGPAAHAQVTIGGIGVVATGTNPDGVAFGDFTGDGLVDLATAIDGPDRLQILVGDGLGGFVAGPTTPIGAGAGAGDVLAFDADGDGDADLAICRKNLGNVLILINNAGSFTTLGSFTTGSESVGTAAGDVDGDGDIDLAVANRGDDTASVLINTGAGFSVTTFGVGPDPRGAALADFDGDGDLDVATSAHDDRTVRLHRNTNNSFTALLTLNLPATVRPEGLVAADLNADGKADIAVAASGNAASFASVFLGSRGGFAPVANYPTGGLDAAYIAVGDLECDGDLDLAVVNQSSNNVALLTNGGVGTFGAPTLAATGAGPSSVAIGNADGDTDLDVAVSNTDANSITVVVNGCGTIVPTDPADLNADGLIDATDLAILIGGWGASGVSDINGDGLTDGMDLSILLGAWS